MQRAPFGSARCRRLRAVRAVSAALRLRPWLPAVVDTVFAASGGGELTDTAGRYAVRDELANAAQRRAHAQPRRGRILTRHLGHSRDDYR